MSVRVCVCACARVCVRVCVCFVCMCVHVCECVTCMCVHVCIVCGGRMSNHKRIIHVHVYMLV